jgi:hypothetical protein
MKMTEIFEEIDGYTIIRGFDTCPIDPEATKAAVEDQIKRNPDLAHADMETLFNTNVVYSDNVGPGRKHVSQEEYAAHKARLDSLGENQLLTVELETIPDFRGTEYWQKAGSRWGKRKIEHIGEKVPANGILSDALTEIQRTEIVAQERADRIAALSPEEKENEKQAQIKAAIHEAALKKQEAEIEAEVNDEALTFDPVAWARERKSEIEALYA